jgi:hypothetical protein
VKGICGRIGRWGGEGWEVSEVVGGGDVLNGDIIGDDKFFDSGPDRFTKREVGFNEEGVGGGGDVEIGLKSTFGGDNGGANGGAGD